MKIFLKYILKSMTEKKGRFLLLIIAISLSTALFIGSLGTVDIAIDAIAAPQLESFENKSIVISSMNEGGFFDDKGINEEGVKNLTKEIQVGAYYSKDDETIDIITRGREEKYIDNKYLIKGSLNEFKGAKCIISERVSKDNDLAVGDKLDIILAGKNTIIEVAGIYGNQGIFYSDSSNSFTMLLPYDYLSSNLGYNGLYNLILADNTEKKVDDSIELFNENNSEYKATKLFDKSDVEEQTASFTQILYYMLAIVVFMSAIIIYSSFKLTITERLPIIGTFLSQGATKATVKKILYLESVIYGIIGAIIGGALGYGALSIINKMVSPLAEYGIYEKLNVNYIYFIYGAVFSIVLSFISALIPINKIRKLQVKEVILNNVNVSMHIGFKKFIIGLILLVISIIVANIEGKWTEDLSVIFILMSFLGVIFVYPKLVDIISNVLYRIFRGRSKSLVLALNNIRTSKVLLGNTTLIIISLIAIFMISSIGSSMISLVTDAYENMDYDICISGISTIRQEEVPLSDEIVKKIETIDGYEKGSDTTLTWLYSYIDDDESKYMSTIGVDPEKFAKYNKYLDLYSDKNNGDYEVFESGKEGILLTSLLSEMYNIKKGDKINLNVNDRNKEVEVIGIIEGKMYNNAHFCLMSFDTLKNLYDFSGGTEVNINTTKDPEEFKKDLKFLNKEYGVNIQTRDEQCKINKEQNEMIIKILNIFSIMAIIIASLGVLNNIIIGFLQRKRDLAVYASVGMQKKHRNLMLIFESLITVFWAILSSIPGSLLVVSLLTKTMRTIQVEMEVKMDFSSVPLYAIATLLIVILATVPVLFKSKKLSIINELKYE